tara:strand:+ start:18 stop:1595 length:1578 start_codon:yes stop_codon:yes gene_type:complete
MSPIQQMLLGFGSAGDPGWLLNFNYRTAVPNSNHEEQAIEGNNGGLHLDSNNKIFTPIRFKNTSNNTTNWCYHIVSPDGGTITNMNGPSASGKNNYIRGFCIDSNDYVYTYNWYHAGGNVYTSWTPQVIKQNSSGNRVTHGSIYSTGNRTAQGPLGNSPSRLVLFDNETLLKHDVGAMYTNNTSHILIVSTTTAANGHSGNYPLDITDKYGCLNTQYYNTNNMVPNSGVYGDCGGGNASVGALRLKYTGGVFTVQGMYFKMSGVNTSDVYYNNASNGLDTRPHDMVNDSSYMYMSYRQKVSGGQGGNASSARPTIVRFSKSNFASRTIYQTDSSQYWKDHDDNSLKLALDSSGNLYCQALLVTNESINGTTTEVESTVFIKWDSSGVIEWMRKLTRPENTVINNTYPRMYPGWAAIDVDGDPIFTGYWKARNNSSGSTSQTDLNQVQCAYMIKYPASGSFTGTIGSGASAWTISNLSYSAATPSNLWTLTSISNGGQKQVSFDTGNINSNSMGNPFQSTNHIDFS